MTEAKPPLVIIGAGEFAEIAFDYFTRDSPYRVVAFSVERGFFPKRDVLFDLPIVAFEDLETLYPPDSVHVFVAVTFTQLNRVRTRLFRSAKARGYRTATYVSPHALVGRNVTIGENCFVFEANVIQYEARIGDNVILWSGNHIGHRATIADNCFITSHVVISGFCSIGDSCFLGVNSTMGDSVRLGSDCVLAAGAVLVKHCDDRRVVRGNPSIVEKADPWRLFGVKEPREK